jgi:hypothetical protein
VAKLNASKRNKLPASEFAGPDRSYPVNDASHAKNAKARASQAENAGRMSASEKAKIDRKADSVLHKQGGAQKQHDADHKKLMGHKARRH